MTCPAAVENLRVDLDSHGTCGDLKIVKSLDMFYLADHNEQNTTRRVYDVTVPTPDSVFLITALLTFSMAIGNATIEIVGEVCLFNICHVITMSTI